MIAGAPVALRIDGKLTPGLFARVRLAASAPHDTVLVLDEAFGTDQSHKFAYVVGEDGKAQYRDVVLGAMHEGFRVGLWRIETLPTRLRPAIDCTG